MKRVLSSIGIGAATVDTILPKTQLKPGETVEVTVELEGGDSDQEITAIYFALLTQVDDDDVVLDQFQLNESFTLATGESRTTTTDITVPRSTPLTQDGQQVWLKTGLDVKWAVDPTDKDTIEIVPDAYLNALLDALNKLGFTTSHIGIEETPWLDRRQFLQKFEFTPDGDQWPDLDGVTVMPVLRGEDLRVFMEIDECESAEHLTDQDYDKQEVSITFDTTNLDIIRRRLKSTIEAHTHV
ncbi:sporulation protein [Haladaptatus halobius]|uniref:sporulation protein n=1 Tax=Haladaptatus halobius TaxID=2884875 RepID=UPI001D0AD960|nr:sporulation protein [Haladaptatus halobius]